MAKVGGARVARWLLVLTGAGGAAGEAGAGAWSQAQGDGQMISTISLERGEFGETWRFDDLVEYGVVDGWEASLKIETSYRYLDVVETRFGAQAGVKRSFAMGERAVIALQGAVLTGDAVQGLDCAGAGYEARAAVGSSFRIGGLDGFANVESAYRTRGEACERRLAEATVGIDLTDGWTSIAKVWTERGGGAETVKAETSLLKSFGNFTLGLGYREEVSGGFEERGVVAAYWSRF